jgi:hypothetical protein
LPAASRERRRKKWEPSERREYCMGEAQGVKGASSRLHSKLASAWLEKEKEAVVWEDKAPGAEVRSAWLGVRSMVQEWVAAEASRLPAASRARTWKV